MKLVAGLTVLLALTGCAAGPSDAPSSGTPTPAQTSATATTSASPSATSTPTDPVITTAGYGDLELGQPVPSDDQLVHWVADWCYPGSTPPPGTSARNGHWIPNDYVEGADADPLSIYVSTEKGERSGAIQRLLITSPDIETKSGAHVGMTVTDLLDLFPDAVKTKQSDVVTLYSVSDSLGQVVFDTGPDDGFAATPGPSLVQYIHIIGPDATPYSVQYSEYPFCG